MAEHTHEDDRVFDQDGGGWNAPASDTPSPRMIGDLSLGDDLTPTYSTGRVVPHHRDEDGIVHFFAPIDIGDQPNFDDPVIHLRYYRAIETEDARLVYDSYPVMPLDNVDAHPFPRTTLELMIEEGDLDNTQELAYHTAQTHELNFPDPEGLPPLPTGVDYRFVGVVEEDSNPALQAVKTWHEGDQERETRLTIASYGMASALDVDLRELDEVRDGFGLQTAMNLAESMAVASGYLHDGRDDARLFTEGPPDPFTTNLERERAGADFTRDYSDEDTQELPAIKPAPSDDIYPQWAADAERKRETNASLNGAAWFEATFADNPEIDLLTPINDTVNYAVVVTDTDPWTSELMVEKFWREPHGYVGSVSLTIDTYNSDDEVQRDVAESARSTLLGVHEERGLEAMMHQAELNAMENGHLSGDRADTRLFREGPPDRFETLAHRLADEPNPFAGIGDDRVDEIGMAQAVSGSWDELIAAQPDEEPARETHYWQTHYRPVETPEGEPLGMALYVTEFPQLPPDFDKYIDEHGMDDSIYPTEARTVEMAHFASEADAAKFDAEFRGYLVPGLLDGPELAPEVAKLEGLSGEWQDMDYSEIVDYMSGRRMIVREETEWHLHNPNAEREAGAYSAGMPLLSDEALVHVEPDDPAPTPNLDF